MYIYLFVILPIFYSIIIHLLFIFWIIYWLATVGDHCRRPMSATYCRRKSRKLQVLLRKIRILRLERLIVSFYSNLNDQKGLSASDGECRRPHRRPGRQQQNSWTHLCGRIRVYSHMHDFISTLSRTHQLLRPILTYLPIFSQCYS